MRFHPGVAALVGVLLWGVGCSHDDLSGSSIRVGDVAPKVHTTKLSDVDGDVNQLTTYRFPDREMYQYSIDEAVSSGKPSVIVFATPAHCTQCDEQLQLLKGIRQQHGDDLIFVHIDQYKNSSAFAAFGVRGDPWMYVVDRKGIVQYIMPGRTLLPEISGILDDVLKG